jgi:hypothetical protein
MMYPILMQDADSKVKESLSILYAPMGLQEMTLAEWLRVREINPSTCAEARLEAMR